MNLNKALKEEFPLIYFTDNYRVEANAENFGYHVINAETGVVENFGDNLPQAVFAMLAMQEAYDEILAEGVDIMREYKTRSKILN